VRCGRTDGDRAAREGAASRAYPVRGVPRGIGASYARYAAACGYAMASASTQACRRNGRPRRCSRQRLCRETSIRMALVAGGVALRRGGDAHSSSDWPAVPSSSISATASCRRLDPPDHVAALCELVHDLEALIVVAAGKAHQRSCCFNLGGAGLGRRAAVELFSEKSVRAIPAIIGLPGAAAMVRLPDCLARRRRAGHGARHLREDRQPLADISAEYRSPGRCAQPRSCVRISARSGSIDAIALLCIR